RRFTRLLAALYVGFTRLYPAAPDAFLSASHIGHHSGFSMPRTKVIHQSWRSLLDRHKVLQLPAAHDALSAKLIERAGFAAYQVGGFALEGARFGVPDIDLVRFGEKSEAVRDIIAASGLPVLVDCDDGYGDVKNVTHTVNVYEGMGVAAIFIEDQRPPKRCGHMPGKEVIPPDEMAEKLRAAAAARSTTDAMFLIARTDAAEPNGLDDAMRRCELYLRTGADAIYIEAEHSEKDLKRIAKEFKGVHKVVNVFEGGGKSPWMSPKQLEDLGFTMALYPTTVLFRVTHAIQDALATLRAGKKMDSTHAVSMKEFELIVELPQWALVESRFRSGPVAKIRKVVDKLRA
ncbi:MAG TPA: isocitrate lyase/PEP mutase family protein, partial [Terriglobales bacterium]|nr:isocitrate lyase/PEP mutase family protein [Terriglobales bacterium]